MRSWSMLYEVARSDVTIIPPTYSANKERRQSVIDTICIRHKIVIHPWGVNECVFRNVHALGIIKTLRKAMGYASAMFRSRQ